MKELTGDPFYSLLKSEFPDLRLDYVLLSLESDQYRGIESHKEAVIMFMDIKDKRNRERARLTFPDMEFTDGCFPDLRCNEEQMCATPIASSDFFRMENLELEPDLEDEPGFVFGVCPKHRSYWQAFYDEPYFTFGAEEYEKLNGCLFGHDLDIYSWNDDFSNYFDTGKKWWGTGLWTIYDKEKERMVIIGASLSD